MFLNMYKLGNNIVSQHCKKLKLRYITLLEKYINDQDFPCHHVSMEIFCDKNLSFIFPVMKCYISILLVIF